ncbi:MAG TPA: hypothetical protein EYP55_02345 [Anaerolineae bacterium]|nr:hypothetical protein [Anaerolineae bacterium]
MTPFRSRKYASLVTIFLIALILRMVGVFYLHGPDIKVSESGQTAAKLVAGKGYTFDFYGYRVTAPLRSFMPPLYTLVLATFLYFSTNPALTLKVFQAIISSLASIVIYFIAAKLFSTRTGFLSSLATAVYPIFIVLATQPVATILTIFLLSLLILSLLRLLQPSSWANWASVGLLLGLNALNRPLILGFFAGILLWLWLNRRGLSGPWYKIGLVMMLFALLAIAPWMVRNYIIHREFVPISTNGGFTFWNGNNPFTTGSGFDVYVEKLRAYTQGQAPPEEASSQKIAIIEPYPLPRELEAEVHTLSEVELDRRLYLAGLRFIRDNPRQWLGLVKAKTISFWWFRPNIGTYRDFYKSAWIMPYKVVYTALLSLFALGLLLSRDRWRRCSLLYLLFIYATVTYVGFNVITRYRWEIESYMFIFAAVAVVEIGRRILPGRLAKG